jgi:hypothetical protein
MASSSAFQQQGAEKTWRLKPNLAIAPLVKKQPVNVSRRCENCAESTGWCAKC